jgi:predicted DNA-binding protein with PD1-like motif
MQEIADGSRWMLRLEEGDDLLPTLAGFAQRQHVRAGAIVSGIGMLRRAEVGYWDGHRYVPRSLETPHELIALHGSIAEVDGAPSLHLHAGLSGPTHELVGGHVIRGTVGILAEIVVAAFPDRVFGRPMDESFGLRRIDLHPGPSP